MNHTSTSETGFLRIWDILGDRKRGIPALLPIGKSTFWSGVASGRYPKPVKLSPRCSGWPSHQIMALLAAIDGDKTNGGK